MSGVEILLDDARGVFIPQDFVRNYDVTLWGFAEDDKDILTLRQGPYPENEWYWEAWNSVLLRAHYRRDDKIWMLQQDGDLFAYCPDLMTYDEQVDFFGWAEGEEAI